MPPHPEEATMPATPLALLAAVLVVVAASIARADELPILPSHICQTPSHDEFAFGNTRDGDGQDAAKRADQWTAAFQAVIARCQEGDILVLATRNAQANMLRYCDFSRLIVQGSPTGETVCVFAGGKREPR
jgi:hypothetical protein